MAKEKPAARKKVVLDNGRYDGRTLREWLPELVDAIREAFNPLRIILFALRINRRSGGAPR